ncbi:MAG: tetratricopeptide repeat protein [Acidobacteria bacterium]|nr:tetratricopeptide repeat protein [Acidobacteriota bacterium]
MLCIPFGVLLAQQAAAFESLLAAAQQAQARSDFESATEFYRQAVKIHSEIPEIRTNLGLMYYQTGKDQQAAEEFAAAIRLKPSLFVPNLFLGLTDLRLTRYDEAIRHLKQAAVLKPSEVQPQLGLGAAYVGIRKPRLAIASYLRAAQLDATKADTWYRLGVTYLEQVEADARLLLTKHRDSAYLQALMGENFSERHAWIQADEAYKKALTSHAFPPGTHASDGFVLLNRHDLANAKLELDAELAANPGSLEAKLGLARLHVEQGHVALGAQELEEIFRTDAAFLRTSGSPFKAGLSQEKRSELQRIFADKPASGTWAELARIVGTGPAETSFDVSQAAGVRKNSVSSPNSPAPSAARLYALGKYRQCSDSLAGEINHLKTNDLRLLASCSYLSGRFQVAFDAAARLAANKPTEVEGLYWETKSAQRLATQTLSRASEMDSTSPKLHVLLGDVYRQQKSFPDAEQEYRKALAIWQDDTGALFGLSLALLADEQMDEALTLAQSALRKNPDDPELNAVMGEILCARNDYSGAEQYLKKSLTTKPEYIPHVHALLGKVYARTGRTEQAIAELRLALADDKDGAVHYQIGRLYLKVGNRDAAREAFDVSAQLRRRGLDRAAVAMQQDDGETELQ